MFVQTLPKSLEYIRCCIQNSLNQGESMTAEKVQHFVEDSGIRAAELAEYADFDHPLEDGYGRKMIFDGGNFEMMAMSWNPGDYSSIHNHGYTQWGLVKVFGNVHHFIYKNTGEELRFAKREILTAGESTKVVNAMIHQMGNPSTERYMTLHIYGCNHKESEVTADAQNYELEHQRINHTTGGAFFNLPETQIYDCKPAPRPTDAVFLNYAKLLMDYYHRQEQTEELLTKKSALLQMMRERLLEPQLV